jgi:DGQHR domain-containing protein
MPRTNILTLNALRIKQSPEIPIYVFGIEGRLVHQLATVSYADRSRDGVLTGYQRRAVKTHIQEILDYLSTDGAILPNAIVIALDDSARFEPMRGVTPSEWGTFGKLVMPLPKNAAQKKPGWIVDGQQRTTALAKLDPKKPFPVVVTAFQAPSTSVQRDQFVLVNKTKPLPRDLLNEILPEVTARLPKNLEKQRVASTVLTRIRFNEDSPFAGRVRGLGGDGEGHNISQAAVIAVILNSLRKKGVLFDYYDGNGKRHKYEAMARTLNVFFEGVRRTWPKAWNSSPQSSRLVHGVGIVALGHLMDRVMTDVDAASPKAASVVASRLAVLKQYCAWTGGKWPGLRCKWNELQNTSQDKARLTDYLLKQYATRA